MWRRGGLAICIEGDWGGTSYVIHVLSLIAYYYRLLRDFYRSERIDIQLTDRS